VGTMDDDVFSVDGEPIEKTWMKQHGALNPLQDMPDVKIDFGYIVELVDEAQSDEPQNTVRLSLPMGVILEVMRWSNYMDFRIKMPGGHGIDGSCGNFNGDPNDDTSAAIIERMGGARVAMEDMLFDHVAPQNLSQEMKDMLESECTGELRQQAKAECGHLDYPPACEYDVCFGMNAHARKEALTFSD